MELQGVALVTGAASGIGQAIALGFIRDGCRKIILVDMNESGLQETKEEALKISKDTQVLTEKCDISDEASVEKVMQSAISEFKRLDYAVNCAGYPGAFNITENYTTSDFDRVQQVNVRGTWLFMRAQIRQMKSQTPLESKNPKIPGPRGSIVNIASTAGLIGIKNLAGYVASKHAINGFTKVAAIEYSKHGIRVNSVCPGVIETNLGRAAPKELVEENLTPVINATPIGRPGHTEEVANVVGFLCSQRSSFVSGSCMTVDGGYTAA